MEEIKDFLHDRIVYLLVGLNTFFNWIGIDNLKSLVLWFLTIVLLIIKIRISYLNMKARKAKEDLYIEIAKEELILSKKRNWSEDQKNFYEKWNHELIEPFENESTTKI
jgi:hypothetical protein